MENRECETRHCVLKCTCHFACFACKTQLRLLWFDGGGVRNEWSRGHLEHFKSDIVKWNTSHLVVIALLLNFHYRFLRHCNYFFFVFPFFIALFRSFVRWFAFFSPSSFCIVVLAVVFVTAARAQSRALLSAVILFAFYAPHILYWRFL